MQVFQFNEEYKVLVDEMGLPVAHSDIAWFISKALEHMHHSSLEMEAIAQRLVRENAPSMEKQVNWGYYTDGFDSKSGIASLKAYKEAPDGSDQG